MAVPETAMYQDGYAVTWKDYVRAAGEVTNVQSKPESLCVKTVAQRDLWFGVSTTNTAHVERSLFRSQNVRHFRASTFIVPGGFPSEILALHVVASCESWQLSS